MAKYIHTDGRIIETNGTRYTVTDADGNVIQSADISRWSGNAEKWIDNDIKNGFYVGYKKVGA
jgi:hypothetical protein